MKQQRWKKVLLVAPVILPTVQPCLHQSFECKPVVKRAINKSSDSASAAVWTLKPCLKQQTKRLYNEYRVACTFIRLETLEDNSPTFWLAMVTRWDTMSTVNVIVQEKVLSSWRWLSKGGWVTGVGDKQHKVLGTMEVPSHKMIYLGEARPLIA